MAAPGHSAGSARPEINVNDGSQRRHHWQGRHGAVGQQLAEFPVSHSSPPPRKLEIGPRPRELVSTRGISNLPPAWADCRERKTGKREGWERGRGVGLSKSDGQLGQRRRRGRAQPERLGIHIRLCTTSGGRFQPEFLGHFAAVRGRGRARVVRSPLAAGAMARYAAGATTRARRRVMRILDQGCVIRRRLCLVAVVGLLAIVGGRPAAGWGGGEGGSGRPTVSGGCEARAGKSAAG